MLFTIHVVMLTNFNLVKEKNGIHDADLITDIVSKIVNEFDPDKIILFGSRAAGNPGKNSDIDLFIIGENISLLKCRKLLDDSRIFVDKIIADRDTVKQTGDSFASQHYYAIHTGVVLYNKHIVKEAREMIANAKNYYNLAKDEYDNAAYFGFFARVLYSSARYAIQTLHVLENKPMANTNDLYKLANQFDIKISRADWDSLTACRKPSPAKMAEKIDLEKDNIVLKAVEKLLNCAESQFIWK